MVIGAFIAAVIASFSAYLWAVRPRLRYLQLRRQRLGEVAPFARADLAEETYRRPWLFPLRVGRVWRAQTEWDRQSTGDKELEALRVQFERRQIAALAVYILSLVSLFLVATLR